MAIKRKRNKYSEGRKSFQYRGSKCLNCKQPLDVSDVYCPYCSQLNSNKQLSLKDFISEFIGSLIVYDSRFRTTLKDLLFFPGRITRNYLNGERVKYANPFRFYLSVSIIYFLVSGLVGWITNEDEAALKELTTPKAETEISGLKIKNTPKDDENIKVMVSENETDTNSLKFEEPYYVAEKDLDTMSWLNGSTSRINVYNSFYITTKIQNAKDALDSLDHVNNASNRWLYQKAISIEKIKNDPTTFANYLIAKTPFFFFFFTPFYALFFLLIYSQKQFSYLAHVIFIFHIFSFQFLLLLIFSIPEYIFNLNILVGLLFFVILPIYFYKALRNFYGQNRFVTILKFVFLSLLFTISAMFAGILFYSVTAAVY